MTTVRHRSHFARARFREHEWRELCERHLPVAAENSIWRLSRAVSAADPEQGWKLHISATILSAADILAEVAPVLRRRGVLFKAPSSLLELSKINCGLFYGFSQVGKCITVYPRDNREAVSLARRLDRLTQGRRGPVVPFDLPLRMGGCVYYRYGSFSPLAIVNKDGTRTPAVRDPRGQLVPDVRGPGRAAPEWAADPFRGQPRPRAAADATPSPLRTTIRAFESISQRGKGGVYRALDLSVLPARLCALKEGRRHGETGWDGRDGFRSVVHESRVLPALASAGVPVPQVYSSFRARRHYYLVTEFIEGDNLQSLLKARRRRLPYGCALHFGWQLSELLSKIHAAGWVWRDCKPLNLIVTTQGILRPVDFEGACKVDDPDPMPWGTRGYVPPEYVQMPRDGSRLPEDLYALGVTLHQLLSGRAPQADEAMQPLKEPRRIHASVSELVSALLDPDPHLRPSAHAAARVLKRAGGGARQNAYHSRAATTRRRHRRLTAL